MTRKFEHIGAPEARSFIVERLSDDALLGRKGFTMRQSTYVLPYPPSQRSYARDLVAAVCADDLPNRGVRAAQVNLYDIVLDYLDSQGMWEPLCEAEQAATRDELIMMLQDTISVTSVIKPARREAHRRGGVRHRIHHGRRGRRSPTYAPTRCWARLIPIHRSCWCFPANTARTPTDRPLLTY